MACADVDGGAVLASSTWRVDLAHSLITAFTDTGSRAEAPAPAPPPTAGSSDAALVRTAKRRRRAPAPPSIPLKLALVLLRLAGYCPTVWSRVEESVSKKLTLMAKCGRTSVAVGAEVAGYLTELGRVEHRHPGHGLAGTVAATMAALSRGIAKHDGGRCFDANDTVGGGHRDGRSEHLPPTTQHSDSPPTLAHATASWTAFSESPIWASTAQFYAAAGDAAFYDGAVPFGISNCRAHARNVADLIAAFSLDVGLEAGKLLTVVDVGSGTGRFGYHLVALLDGMDLRGVRVKLLLVDLAVDAELVTREGSPWHALVAAGAVDWARLPPLVAGLKDERLVCSGERVEAALGRSDAVVVTANYLVDSCTHDLYFKSRCGTVREVLCTVDSHAPGGMSFGLSPARLVASERYPGSPCGSDRALAALSESIRAGAGFAVPVGFFETIQALAAPIPHSTPGILIVSDKTCTPEDYSDPASPPPAFDRHGEECVSLAISLPQLGIALAAAFPPAPPSLNCHRGPSFSPDPIIATQASNVFQTAVYPFGSMGTGDTDTEQPLHMDRLPTLTSTFALGVGTFATSDWEAISSFIDERDCAVPTTLSNVKIAIGLLRLSALDMDEFDASQPGLITAVTSTDEQTPELVALCRAALGARFVQPGCPGSVAIDPKLAKLLEGVERGVRAQVESNHG